MKTEILYGLHPVREALRSKRRRFACLYIARNKRVHRYDAIRALALMRRTGGSRLVVVEDDRLAGVVSLKDMLEFLSLKVDLDE